MKLNMRRDYQERGEKKNNGKQKKQGKNTSEISRFVESSVPKSDDGTAITTKPERREERMSKK